MSTIKSNGTFIHKPVGRETGSNGSIGSKNIYNQFVRYASSNAKQEPELRHIDDKIPDNACFVSPIYNLNKSQISEQHNLSNPHAVSDRNIANKLQNIAQEQQTVLYPVYVESDAPVSFNEQIDWIQGFCREYLNVEPDRCSWYYSGNRSIHAHVPLLATEIQIDSLREYGKQYEYDIDAQVYSRKRQFRLPGVEHTKTGLRKVRIQPDWNNDRIIRKATTTDVSTPETFRDILNHTFGSDLLQRPQRYLWEPADSSEPIDPGLNDWESHYTHMPWSTLQKWKAHYSTPVSPYANAGNGNRSLLVAKIVDGEYGEKRKKLGEYEGEQPYTFVPSGVLKFFGCDREYTTTADYRPVKLSKADYEKFADLDIEPGDMYAVIGGKSRKSRVFKLSTFEANTIARGERFRGCLDVLEYFEYETGQAGLDGSGRTGEIGVNEIEDTKAHTLQKQAENKGIDTLTHVERTTVANRLLQIRGVDETRKWFKQQYGEDFDRELTDNQLRSICDRFEDLPDYDCTSNVESLEI